MKDYIERAAVKDEILSWAVCINHPELLSKEDTMYCIDNIPAADVAEVRHARWIELSRSSKCSECEFETGRYEPARKFCPACGALMDGEETPTCHDGVCEIPGVERKEGNHVE